MNKCKYKSLILTIILPVVLIGWKISSLILME